MPEITQLRMEAELKLDGMLVGLYLISQPFLLTTSSTALRGAGSELKLATFMWVSASLFISSSSVRSSGEVPLFHGARQWWDQATKCQAPKRPRVGLKPSLSSQEYSRETENYRSQEISWPFFKQGFLVLVLFFVLGPVLHLLPRECGFLSKPGNYRLRQGLLWLRN